MTRHYDLAKSLVEANMDKLKLIAEALLEHEVLDGADIDAVLEGRPLVRKARPVAPTYAEKDRAAKEKKKSLFAPKPRPVEG
ncbi:MAG: hypothetical protein HYY06_08685 [Deltaproteobacteria bacterium]|nr:hypothetical protein [Deltaproteobacteria bacterium]